VNHENARTTGEIAYDSDIYVDRNAQWFFRGAPIIRKEIIQLFCEHLELDEAGYHIQLGRERARIHVEDTVVVVVAASLVKDDREAFLLDLSDGTQEYLDIHTFRITEGNIPYCTVKEGRFPARFLRTPTYQVVQYAEYDEMHDEYYLVLNGERVPLQVTSGK
jgi:hypothetical protein